MNKEQNTNLPTLFSSQIVQNLSEKGFYLYEWISKDELKMSIQSDYFHIMGKSIIPLSVVSFVFGVLGFIFGTYVGAIIAVLGVLGIFNIIVFFIFLGKIIQKGKIYSKFANVILTDSHISFDDKILPQNDFNPKQKTIKKVEKIFSEKFFGNSTLHLEVADKKDNFKEKISETFDILSKFLQALSKGSRSKDSSQAIGIIYIVIFLVGAFLSITIGISYLIGLPLMVLTTSIFSKIYYKALLLNKKTEYKINNYFSEIKKNSDNLEIESQNTRNLLIEAKNNNWTDNLSGKINSSFEKINKFSLESTNESIELRKILQNSDYKDIFNFTKYDFWLKNQIIMPMQKMVEVLENNEKILSENIKNLENQITETKEISHQKPLELQKTRLKMQLENFGKIKKNLEQNISKIS